MPKKRKYKTRRMRAVAPRKLANGTKNNPNFVNRFILSKNDPLKILMSQSNQKIEILDENKTENLLNEVINEVLDNNGHNIKYCRSGFKRSKKPLTLKDLHKIESSIDDLKRIAELNKLKIKTNSLVDLSDLIYCYKWIYYC